MRFNFRSRRKEELSFEESLGDEWAGDFGVAETPLDLKVFAAIKFLAVLIGVLVVGRIIYLVSDGHFYRARAEANLAQVERLSAPRGIIFDTNGKVLAQNRAVFLASLMVPEFLKQRELRDETLKAINDILEIKEDDFWKLINKEGDEILGNLVVLSVDLNQDQIIKLKSLNLPTLKISQGFTREYISGPAFSSVLGYTGIVSPEELRQYPKLGGQDWVGKTGIEAFYEEELRGTPGVLVKVRDAKGNILEEKEEEKSTIGREIKLTIDAELQNYFYKRLSGGLKDLGLKVGVGLVINPKTGAVLSLINIPSFDNNIFSSYVSAEEIEKLFSSLYRPFFNRAISGLYSPGSTIKPLHALAALSEGVITSEQEIFSPGYLDVPNPYNPDEPTRFLDWRYQGSVNLTSAIAQSSNVYFYIVGGGSPRSTKEIPYQGPVIKGLGIQKLNEWWDKFGLGRVTGIDLFGEAKGSLPTLESKKEKKGEAWVLGDTYNVSIGQGDLLVTPLQLLNYISGISNGGKIFEPFLVNSGDQPKLLYDLSGYADNILEVNKGMEKTVESSRGTARTLNDLPMKVAAKTGSAQVANNTRENAFFVGYAPAENPEIAILVLVEDAREGSLNAVPIAKDVFYWYYLNRIKK